MILKYPGGKSKVAPHIRLPKKFDTYVEPFVGGGSVFFHLSKEGELDGKRVFLSDTLWPVINLYRWAASSEYEQLVKRITQLGDKHSKAFYYVVRDKFNEAPFSDSIFDAARFYYLNRTSFNGLIRFNRRGRFNVPYGDRPFKFDPDSVCVGGYHLSKVERIDQYDFRLFPIEEREGVFAYFDPPYPGGFNQYNGSGFDVNDYQDLFDMLCMLDDRGVKWTLSYPQRYSDNYRRMGYQIQFVTTRTSIGPTGAERGEVDEVLIYNY